MPFTELPTQAPFAGVAVAGAGTPILSIHGITDTHFSFPAITAISNKNPPAKLLPPTDIGQFAGVMVRGGITNDQNYRLYLVWTTDPAGKYVVASDYLDVPLITNLNAGASGSQTPFSVSRFYPAKARYVSVYLAGKSGGGPFSALYCDVTAYVNPLPLRNLDIDSTPFTYDATTGQGGAGVLVANHQQTLGANQSVHLPFLCPWWGKTYVAIRASAGAGSDVWVDCYDATDNIICNAQIGPSVGAPLFTLPAACYHQLGLSAGGAGWTVFPSVIADITT
jgi:hypothetical protein